MQTFDTYDPTYDDCAQSHHTCASPIHLILRSSCRFRCSAGPGLEFGRLTPTPTKRRSQCLGGEQCEAGCEIHKKKRKRTPKPSGVLIPNSGQGLEPEIEFSEDDDNYLKNNRLNYERLHNYRQNGYHLNDNNSCDSDEDVDEEITVIRRVTNIFRTTINSTSKLIDSVTPNSVKEVRDRCPKTWMFFTLLLFLGPLMYAFSHHMSSPFNRSSLDELTSDMPSKYAIERLINEMKAIKSETELLKTSMDKRLDGVKHNDNERGEKILGLDNKMDKIEDIVNNIVKKCCKNETDSMLALIDMRLSAFMSQMMSNNQNSRQSMTPQEVAQELKAFINLELSKTNDVFKENFEQRLITTIERFEQKMVKKRDEMSSDISVEEVKSLISQALAIYDADKTGQPDFALEPAGGTVINTRCSETFDPHGVQYKIFGIPFWSSSVSPRAVIQPSISPGECWAFSGSTGHLVIKLSQPITPTAFSYEHIPKQISRDGNIDSAPKEFQVRGLDDESDTSGHLLGNYVYEDNNTPMQFFEVQDPNPRPLQYIELVVLSNHGHNQYTCLYRFRVHGKRVDF